MVSVAWIESHQELKDHPKTLKLAALLNLNRAQVVGHLHLLWWWAMSYAEDGNVQRYDVTDLAIAAGWEGDPDKFVNALKECGPGGTSGFLDDDDWLHDWDQYGGKLLAKRRADADRKREQRARTPEVQGMSNGRGADIRATAHVEESRGEERTSSSERREDVDTLCDTLADCVASNTGKRPNITSKWRDEARRLIDIDKVEPDEAERVMRWATSDSFWRSNIMSMPKFREKYTQLKLRSEPVAVGGPAWVER